jgi:hypothetical protein
VIGGGQGGYKMADSSFKHWKTRSSKSDKISTSFAVFWVVGWTGGFGGYFINYSKFVYLFE